MSYLCNMISDFKNWLRRRTFFVIADPADNSITFSKALFRHMDVMEMNVAKVCVFRVADEYAFAVNPDIEQETQLADIQYNSKFRSIGFECLVPTVNRIVYDYGLMHDKPIKLSVRVERAGKMRYYVFCRPRKEDGR